MNAAPISASCCRTCWSWCTLTRLKSAPALQRSRELPETERTRGAALADRLSVPTLARAWQMLLKGVGEVERPRRPPAPRPRWC